MQIMTNRLSDHGEKIGLGISCDKMSSEQHLPLKIGRQDVERFQYLGSYRPTSKTAMRQPT